MRPPVARLTNKLWLLSETAIIHSHSGSLCDTQKLSSNCSSFLTLCLPGLTSLEALEIHWLHNEGQSPLGSRTQARGASRELCCQTAVRCKRTSVPRTQGSDTVREVFLSQETFFLSRVHLSQKPSSLYSLT